MYCLGTYACSPTIIQLGTVLVNHWSRRLNGSSLLPFGLKGFVLVVTQVVSVDGLTEHSACVQIRYLSMANLEFLSLDRRHRLKIESASRCRPLKDRLRITDYRLRNQSCNRIRKWLFVSRLLKYRKTSWCGKECICVWV